MKKVTAPDGRKWTVRRRWISRKVDLQVWEGFQFAEIVDELASIPVVGYLLAALFLLLLILFGLALVYEILIAVVLLVATVIGRYVFRRPWIVEASTEDEDACRRWKVSSRRLTGEIIPEIAQSIETGSEFISPYATEVEVANGD